MKGCRYFLGAPCFVVQAGLYTWIKYQVGFFPADGIGHGNPVPWTMWPQHLQAYVRSLQVVNAWCWWCELVVHIEELMFVRHQSKIEVGLRVGL